MNVLDFKELKTITNMNRLILFIFSLFSLCAFAQVPPTYTPNMVNGMQEDVFKKVYLIPQRIVWQSSDSLLQNADVLLQKGKGQVHFEVPRTFRIRNNGQQQSGIILDFGKEIQGGVQITAMQSTGLVGKVRLRFGESVSEVFGESNSIPIGEDGSTNHHALRDFEMYLPGFGTIEVGNTGFRFLRLDLVEPNKELVIQEVRATSYFRDIPYLGSFKSNDERLNKIWETGAYTVHLNMLDYIVDGIKRDRMVWSGDIHPEIMTINHVFGYQDIVPKSLDFLRDNTPVPNFMNGIPSYSLWWIIMQSDWYHYHGKLDYLQQQKTYLQDLLKHLTKYVDENGVERLEVGSMRFLDWPSKSNTKAVHAGLHAMMAMAFEKGGKMLEILGESNLAVEYVNLAEKMKKYKPDPNQNKQAASLLSWSGIMDASAMNSIVGEDGAKNFGAFFGYYMLQAQARAGDYTAALHNIRDFWGGMLDLGATTFWEEFDLEEAKNAGRIDEIVPKDKLDYHKDTGIECYIGLRRSLCHGWASGPTAWLSEHVLGVEIVEARGKKIRIKPNLGDLEWVEGTYPTSNGLLYLKHVKQKDGTIKSTIKAPKGVKIVKS